jgi:SulP family sulfate permease
MKSKKLNMKTLRSDLVSGFATGLFSIPEGMAYAKLAGVNPVYGLYSGMISTVVASLTTGSILMISTLTSAIALSTASVIQVAGIHHSQVPQALFTITFLVGSVMFLTGGPGVGPREVFDILWNPNKPSLENGVILTFLRAKRAFF